MTTPQKRVAQAVADRGYRDGWTAEQYAVRQILKLGEELGELAACIHALNKVEDYSFEPTFVKEIRHTGWLCREIFDNLHKDAQFVVNTAQTRKEAPDIQVSLFTLAEALAELDGQPFDVVSAAMDKATADVARGKRVVNNDKLLADMILAKAREKQMRDFSDDEIRRVFGGTIAPDKCEKVFRKLMDAGLLVSDLSLERKAEAGE